MRTRDFLLTSVLLGIPLHGHADTLYWNPDGSSTALTGSNWYSESTGEPAAPSGSSASILDTLVFANPSHHPNAKAGPGAVSMGASLGLHGLIFEDGFNETNATTISNNTSTNRYIRLREDWSVENRATGGSVTFTRTGSGIFGISLNGNGTIHAAAGASIDFDPEVVLLDETGSLTGGFTKTGAGTLSLGGDNSYSGGTTVAAGTLNLAGGSTGSGDVAVEAGAILAGHGTVAGNLDLAAGSIFSWSLTGNTNSPVDAGTAYGAIAGGGGDLHLGGAIFRIVLGEEVDFGDSFWASARTWDGIFSGFGSTSGEGFTAIDVAGTSPTGGSFGMDGTTLTWSAVPEPSSLLAGLLLGAGLLRRRRR